MRARTYAAISPDGNFIAYGWQDAAGHYVDDIGGQTLARVGVVETVSDTPYHVLFTDDSKRLLSNTRHMQSGVMICVAVEAIRGIEEYGDVGLSAGADTRRRALRRQQPSGFQPHSPRSAS